MENRRPAMKKNNGKVIKFPLVKNASKSDQPAWEIEGLEDWEIELEYIETENWDGLIKYREKICRERPDNPYAECMLGEAYILSEDYERALVYLTNIHQKFPDFEDVQFSILDALFALGKTENDFSWVRKPTVVRLNGEILDHCMTFLKTRKNPQSIFEIYDLFTESGYLKFDEEELTGAMKQDGRFEIFDDDLYGPKVGIKTNLSRKKQHHDGALTNICAWCQNRISDQTKIFWVGAKSKVDLHREEGRITTLHLRRNGRAIQALVTTKNSEAKLQGNDLVFMVCCQGCGKFLKKTLAGESDFVPV